MLFRSGGGCKESGGEDEKRYTLGLVSERERDGHPSGSLVAKAVSAKEGLGRRARAFPKAAMGSPRDDRGSTRSRRAQHRIR
mgnify:CR=1 FL=1